MVKISSEDITRLFSEMNEGPMLGKIPGKEDWLDSNFTESGREYLMEFVYAVFPNNMEHAIEEHGMDVPDAFLSVMSAIFIGGVMLGWQLKEQYASSGTPFDE